MANEVNNSVLQLTRIIPFEVITCVVGHDRVKILAPKGALAYVSSLLQEMVLEADAQSRDHIVFENESPEIFKHLVEFAITSQLRLSGFEEAVKVLEMAHRYTVLNLIEKSLEFLTNNFQYEFAFEYADCLKLAGKEAAHVILFCQRHAQELLDFDRHLAASPATFEAFLSGGAALNITSELSLLDAIMRYKDANPCYSIADARAALLHVRLLTVDAEDVMRSAKLKVLLSPEEICQVLNSICMPNRAFKLPPIVSTCRERRVDLMLSGRICLASGIEITMRENSVHSITLTTTRDVLVVGQVLAVPGGAPLLDVTMKLYKDRGSLVQMERFRLKDVTAEGRRCLWMHPVLIRRGLAVSLSCEILSPVVVHGAFVGPINGFAHDDQHRQFDPSEQSHLHAILKNILLIEDERGLSEAPERRRRHRRHINMRLVRINPPRRDIME